MRSNKSFGKIGAFLLCVVVSGGLSGCMDGADLASHAGERQTKGCGAGVVRLQWESHFPVRLRIYESNVSLAGSTIARTADAGAHSFSSRTHTVTWSFEDEAGKPSAIDAVSSCSTSF